MKNLINFIMRYSAWFVFSFYVVLSLILLFTGNNYQRSVYLTSANVVTGSIYKGASQVTGYFHLKKINQDLQANNALLQNEVLNLKNELAQYKVLASDSLLPITFADRFGYVSAAVINNNTSNPQNFFTIDKGSLDGITTGMGVVDHNGIAGIVNVTGPHISRVISLLNESQHFSVKLKDTEFIGSMCWKGNDPSIGYVEEIPRHARFNIGDTIVTSGYSTTFPEGIPVGTVLALYLIQL
ncbi:MAG: rod shape-determining protein MreC [Muribaculaceae bacterium]|nr:rod shape-determining protein MreC [Muribaculaceae bacterium]